MVTWYKLTSGLLFAIKGDSNYSKDEIDCVKILPTKVR